MPRSITTAVLLLTAFAAAGLSGAGAETPVIPAGFHQIRLNGHTFTLPEGFSIELAAGPTLIERPIVAAMDDNGCLYVCCSSGSNENVNVQLKKKPHRVIRLEDSDGDGLYDRACEFISNVMLPEGAMWFDGSLYVSAPPQIMKFTDTMGTGKADKQEVWFDGKTLTGCANDLHGPYLGLDGCIYWCKGAFARQEYKLPNGKLLSTRCAHIFRARPDGSQLEPVMTGGMDNPVDVIFTPSGERIFSTTFFQHPGNGRRDGLVHAIHGAIYGKDHDPIYEHPWTGPELMPVLTHLGPAAPCGLHRYESVSFGPEYRDNIFCCQFNLRKVSRHMLVASGSTFITRDFDFVTSDNLDFHPTDVIEDADGSLLIVDTGGWYKLCCPSSQLVKPDVLGAIYRVRNKQSPPVADPRGRTIDWLKLSNDQLLSYLGDPRFVVRNRAIQEWAKRGENAAPALARAANNKELPAIAKQGAIWALARIPAPAARIASRAFLDSSDETTRNSALQCTSLWRDRGAEKTLIELLAHPSPATRRLACEALGRIGDASAVAAILTALADDGNDRALDHALTFALMEIGDARGAAAGLHHASPRVKRAALAALDGMPEGKLDAESIIEHLDAQDGALRSTAWWIAGRHPDWGDKLASYFEVRLRSLSTMPAVQQEELLSHLAPFLNAESIRKQSALALSRSTAAPEQKFILRAMEKSGLKVLPKDWASAIAGALKGGDEATARAAISTLRAFKVTAADAEDLKKAARMRPQNDRPWPRELGYSFRAALSGPLSDAEAGAVIADVHRDQPAAVRAAAIDLLASARLSDEALVALARALPQANGVDLSKLLPAFQSVRSEKVGLALIQASGESPLRSILRAEQLRPILEKYPPAVRDAAEKLYTRLADERKGELEKLERLFKALPAGEHRRGQAVFNSSRAQCGTCHKIGYVGGSTGPDLTRVGSIRSDRDLLESIVLPSASFVRSYEPVKVVTADGRTLNGILKKDAPDEIVLVVAADKEERIARTDIEEMAPGSVSIMPAGLDQMLTPQELADLLAFLRACR